MYQAQILDRVRRGDNLLVIAPTGAGKTEIAIRRSGELLETSPQAKIVMLCNYVNLAMQQAGKWVGQAGGVPGIRGQPRCPIREALG